MHMHAVVVDQSVFRIILIYQQRNAASHSERRGKTAVKSGRQKSTVIVYLVIVQPTIFVMENRNVSGVPLARRSLLHVCNTANQKHKITFVISDALAEVLIK